MEITVEFISQKGFWQLGHFKTKILFQQWIKALHPQTAVCWMSKNRVSVSQQYCTGGHNDKK